MEIYNDFQLFFNCDIDDSLVLFELKSKGYLSGTILEINNGNKYTLNFYDSTRFKQDVDEELAGDDFFYEENVVIIRKITKDNILVAVNNIVMKKTFEKMILRI